MIHSEFVTNEKDQPVRCLVLIVEDGKDFQLLARHTLLNAGFRVVLANNGQEGLSYIEDNGPPDIVISDIQMPFMTGLEMLAELKRRPTTINLPVLMVSIDSSGRGEALRLGAGGFLTKGDCSLVASLVSEVQGLVNR